MGAAIIIAFVLGYCLTISLSSVSQVEIQHACEAHQGVHQIITHELASIKGSVTVVCKDGTVRKAN